MPTDKPTKKQTLVLEFIRDFTAAHGFSPSYREIRDGMHLRSIGAVAEHVDNCIARGYLRKTPGAARSLELVDPAADQPAYAVAINAAIEQLTADPSIDPKHAANPVPPKSATNPIGSDPTTDVATLRRALEILDRLPRNP
jgi:SOS-response transcriptional repressor LexA